MKFSDVKQTHLGSVPVSHAYVGLTLASNGIQFVNGGTLSPEITATGGANSTTINQLGFFDNVSAPAIEYDPVTHTAIGLRTHGPTRQNYITSSAPTLTGNQDQYYHFDNVNGMISGQNAIKYTRVTTGTPPMNNPGNTITGAAVVRYCQSSIIETVPGELSTTSTTQLTFYRATATTGVYASASFNWKTGVATVTTSGGSPTAVMTLLSTNGPNGGNVYQISLSYGYPGDSSTHVAYHYVINESTAGAALIVHHRQLELIGNTAGALGGATSPIKTTTVAVTRTSDQPTISNIEAKSWWNPNEGTMLVDFTFRGTAPASDRMWEIIGADANNRILVYYSTGSMFFQVRVAGSDVVSMSNGIVPTIGSTVRIVCSWTQDRFLMTTNGGTVLSDFSGSIPAGLTRLWLGCEGGGGPADGTIRVLKYWPKAANASELPNIGPETTTITGDTVIDLFSNGEQGAWYDPSDFTTLFQDNAGRSVVTAAGQPVGLMLDKRLGLVRGPELIPQPLNLTSGAWSTLGTLSAVTANSFTNTSGAGAGRKIGVLTVGKYYEVIVDYNKSDSTTDFQVQVGLSNPYAVNSVASTGVLRTIIAATTTELYLRLAGNATLTVNSVTVKELPGNHLFQNTSTARPLLQTENGLWYLQPDGVNDRMIGSAFAPGVDKVLTCFGVRRVNDAAQQTIMAMVSGGAAGQWRLSVPNVAGGVTTAIFVSAGSSAIGAIEGAGAPSPGQFVYTGIGDISGDVARVRRNGVQTVNNNGDQGTGNYLSQAPELFTNNGANFWQGRFYGGIVRFSSAISNAAQIRIVESWVNSKTRAF